ncbi:hypothetical protein EH240_19805 [Mesorhizobium tamadayense]|uniref:Uncharacterized protein n=1 Tax=Mesorhizobium tamadayense TaxID=425306 RepID=A0A3P3FH78_9HYPH|nr:hypothetical protein [Mesorhizobium tamadayense]RRH98044.1 hypothetical protein EH240_19805 [Mesorhizobium tamadayense]
MTNCAVPACQRDAAGRHNPFCVDHYFQLPKAYTGLVTRTSIECSRTDDLDTKQHLREQLDSYTRLVAAKLPNSGAASAPQAAPDSARRPQSPPCVAAGAPKQGGFFDV